MKLWRKVEANKELLLLFTFGLAIRIIWILNMNCAFEGDSNARLRGVYEWCELHTQIPRLFFLSILYPSVDWLPLHYYLNGLVIKLTGDTIYAPRLLAALFGSATVIPLYKLCLQKFTEKTGIIAIFLFTFYGAYTLISTQIMSEPFYLFFLLYSLYFFEKYLQLHQGKYLFLLGLSLVCCSLLRYEGWIFCLLITALITISHKWKWQHLLGFITVAISGIVYVMVLEHLRGMPPLYGILHSDAEVKELFDSQGRNLWTQFYLLRYSFIPFYFLAAGYFLWSKRGEPKPNLLYSFAPYFLPLLALIAKLCQFTITPQYRYLMLYMLPALPFIANLICLGFEYYKFSLAPKILSIGIIMVVMNYSLVHHYWHNELNYPKGFLESAAFAKSKINEGAFYLDYGGNNNFSYWSVRSNLLITPNIPQARLDSVQKIFQFTLNEMSVIKNRAIRKHILYGLNESDIAGKTWKFADFETLVNRKEINYVLLFPNGVLNKYLHLTQNKQALLGVSFKRIFEENGYCIYEIIYPV